MMRSIHRTAVIVALGVLGCTDVKPAESGIRDQAPVREPRLPNFDDTRIQGPVEEDTRGPAPGQSGIRGRVPVGEDTWAPPPGAQICASQHELSAGLTCATIQGDGSFALALQPGRYWLCARTDEKYMRCSSLCGHSVSPGEVTEVGLDDFLTPKPDGQGFYGTSTGSFGESGYLDVAHPLRVCVGPPNADLRTPTAELTCVETDRCGRYALSVAPGDYRLLFAEKREPLTSDRQRCLYHVSAGRTFAVDRETGRGASPHPAECADGSSADPISDADHRANE